ncbi:MAG: glycoside hydrolase domain-containing protein [Nocardioides sp.]
MRAAHPRPVTVPPAVPLTGVWRVLTTGLLTAVVAGLLTLVSTGLAAPASAGDGRSAEDFTGYAFDTRCAPTQEQMDLWRTTSPFWGVGVYIGGSMASCQPTDQPHLDAAWVTRQTHRGWRVLPLWVGPQASCYGTGPGLDLVDPTPTDSYAAARAQGAAEAVVAVRTARGLGIEKRRTLWYDLEGFDVADTDCRRSALAFLSGWTREIRHRGYVSGVYSSVSAGIHALDNADRLSPGSYEMPDRIWYAWDNGRDDTAVKQRWVRKESWADGARIHQYALDVTAAYGGLALTIDRNVLDLGRGSVAPRARPSCGVRVSFPDYRNLRTGASGAQVDSLQCLLRQAGDYPGPLDGRLDRDVQRAVRAFQQGSAVRPTGRVDARTWTSLLSRGTTPVLKHGSAEDAVRRVQRALNAATRADLEVDGVVDDATTRWVRAYQRAVGLPVTGVVADDTWAMLHYGAR